MNNQIAITQGVIPQSREAEQALIGALLYDNQIYQDINSIVSSSDFYNLAHQKIYSVISELLDDGKLADAIVLKNKFSQDEILKDIGGVEYLALLLDSAPVGAVATEYAVMIRELSTRRSVAKLCEETKNKILDPECEEDMQVILSGLVDDVSNAHADSGDKQTFTTTEQGVNELFFGETGRIIKTGIKDLDDNYPLLTQGITILAGRSSQGKSAVAAQIALNTSKEGYRVDYFTLEMAVRQVVARMTTSEMHLSGSFLAYRELNTKETRAEILDDLYAHAIDTAHNLPFINWNEKSGLTVSDIMCNVMKETKKGKKPDLVVIDYINLINTSDIKQGSQTKKNEVLGEVVLRLREFAKSNDLCILLLVQLNRNAVQRSDMGRPVMEDIKESGNIEELADMILLVYRKAYYMYRTYGNDMSSEILDEYTFLQNKMEIICGKNRMGATGSVLLDCGLQYNYISSPKY